MWTCWNMLNTLNMPQHEMLKWNMIRKIIAIFAVNCMFSMFRPCEHALNKLRTCWTCWTWANMSKHEIVFWTWKKNIWTCSMFKTLKNTEHGETCSERCKTGKKHAAAPWPHFLKSGVKGQQHVSACFAVFSMFSMFEYVQCMFKLLFFVNIGQTWLKQDVNMLKHAEHAEHASTWNAEMKHDQKNICHFCSQLHV